MSAGTARSGAGSARSRCCGRGSTAGSGSHRLAHGHEFRFCRGRSAKHVARQGCVVTGVALALALALLVLPPLARPRLAAMQMVSHARQRIPVFPCVLTVGLALALVVHLTAVQAGAMVVATLAARRRRRSRQRRSLEEATALQAAMDVLVGELRVGAHKAAAFDVAATEVLGAVGVSLRSVAARARLGADVAAGLHTVAGRSAMPSHWERLAVSWHLAQTHGLAIGTLMRTAQRDIVERERFSARVNAGLAGARTTAAILAGLPLLGVGLGQLIGAPAGVPAVRRRRWVAAGGWCHPGVLRLAVVGPHHRSGAVMSLASLLLAAALLITVNSPRLRARAGLVVPASRHRTVLSIADDPLAAASSLDVLAACLSSGMPVSSAAAAAAASSAPPQLSRLLNRAADLLAPGADPATAWSNPPPPPRGSARSLALDNHGEALLRLARRSASSGTALAHGVAELATQSRHDAADTAGAAAQRASVLIAEPLGLCYLPAFLCLGIVPVVAGLAGDVLRSGLM